MATINDTRLREILTGCPTVAVLGVHTQPDKAAYYVPEYLHDEGYRIIGVNPQFTTEEVFGEKVRASLAERLVAATHACEHKLFAGKLDTSKLGSCEKLPVRMAHGREGDWRDWQEVDAWADSIATALLDTDS